MADWVSICLDSFSSSATSSPSRALASSGSARYNKSTSSDASLLSPPALQVPALQAIQPRT